MWNANLVSFLRSCLVTFPVDETYTQICTQTLGDSARFAKRNHLPLPRDLPGLAQPENQS